jgi:hypothetical protein
VTPKKRHSHTKNKTKAKPKKKQWTHDVRNQPLHKTGKDPSLDCTRFVGVAFYTANANRKAKQGAK